VKISNSADKRKMINPEANFELIIENRPARLSFLIWMNWLKDWWKKKPLLKE